MGTFQYTHPTSGKTGIVDTAAYDRMRNDIALSGLRWVAVEVQKAVPPLVLPPDGMMQIPVVGKKKKTLKGQKHT